MTLAKKILVAMGISLCLSCLTLTGCSLAKVYTLDDYELKEFVAEASDYSKLSIETEENEIIVRTTNSDQIKISYYSMDKDSYLISQESGEIKLTSTNDLDLGFFISIFGYSTPKKTVTVELPKTVSLDMEYDVKYGDINLSGIDTDKSLKIKTDSVKVNLQNVTSSELEIDAQYGQVEFDGINVEKDLDIEGEETAFNLNNINAQDFSFYNKEGKLHMQNVSSKTVKCNTDSVTVNFTQIDSDDIEMTAEYGSLTGSFAGKSDEYTVTGNVKDGKSNLSDFKGTGSKNIKINGESANVDISFAE